MNLRLQNLLLQENISNIEFHHFLYHLFALSLPTTHNLHTDVCIHIQKRHQDTAAQILLAPLNKDAKAEILKMLNRRMSGKKLISRFNTETEPHISPP